MSRFLLPFREGRNSLRTFSPTAMFVSAVCIAVLASIQTDLRIVIMMLFMLVIGGTVARTRWRLVLSLVAKIEFIVLILIVLEPFLYGQTILFTLTTPWGVLNAYLEGVTLGALLGLRMLFLVTLFVGTLSQMSLSDFMGALRSLRFPVTVLGSLVIMLRYVPLFLSERTRMQEALVLRGFERGERSSRLISLGFMVGSTIDRAFGRSRAVYESMTLRGFGRGMMIRAAGVRRGDAYLLLTVVLAILGLWFGVPWFFWVMHV